MICDDAELILALASMGDVDGDELRTARDHARTCARCTTAEREYAQVLDTVSRAAVVDGPPPELRRRILDSLGDGGAPASATARLVPRRPWYGRWWERVPSGRPISVMGFAGMAAAVSLAVVLGLSSHSPATVVTQPLQAGLNQPGLSGTLTYYRPTGDVVLSVHGLPDAPTTRSGDPALYELWLIRGGGGVAPAGVLARQPDGTWSAVVHRQAAGDVSVAATVEPAPGTSSPTGPQLFQSALPQS